MYLLNRDIAGNQLALLEQKARKGKEDEAGDEGRNYVHHEKYPHEGLQHLIVDVKAAQEDEWSEYDQRHKSAENSFEDRCVVNFPVSSSKVLSVTKDSQVCSQTR